MNKIVFGKQLIAVILLLGLVAGCASTPEKAPDRSAEVGQAIDAAKSALAQARSLDWMWRDSEKLLTEAEAAAAAGNADQAIALANQSREQAELAVNQYYLEKAKIMFDEASSVAGLSGDQQNTLAAAGMAIRNAEGRKAYDLLTPLLTELRTANIDYKVMHGDSLWSISAKPDVYANPYQWPLIYKANRDQIKDADLIYPGQNFRVIRNPSAAETEMAIDHARSRGAWSIGVVEEKDRGYLSGSGSLDLQ
jgi:nucleoid-associated protein YgaU